MGEVLVVDRPAPLDIVELEAGRLAELAEQQSDASLRAVLPESAFVTPPETDETPADDPTDLPEHLAREEYQRSLEAYRTLGALALAGELDTAEAQVAKESLRRMFVTSLAEILENDKEFRGFFEINDYYEYDIQDGHVMAAPGKRMVDMVRDGAAKSRAEAAADPRMITQANRDDADVYNAERVDQITGGTEAVNTRFVISKSPRQAIAADPDFWKRKGYREGLAFGQLYYYEAGKQLAATFSIDNVNDAGFDQVLAELGVHVPENRTSDYAVLDGVERTFSNREQAIAFAKAFRTRCYQLQGDTRHRQSVNEFMQARTNRINAAFEALSLPLSMSVQSSRKHDVIQTFVGGLLQAEKNFKPEVVAQLRTIRESDTFTDDDGRLLAGLSLYAVAEELYDDARQLVNGEAVAPAQNSFVARSESDIAQYLAGRVHVGVAAGRSHGGACAGVVDISNKQNNKETGELDLENPQDAYGGRDQSESNRIPAQIRCIKCRKYSPREKVVHTNLRNPDKDYWGCPHCRYKIDVCTGKVLRESSVDNNNSQALGERLLALVSQAEQPDKPESDHE